VLGFLLVAVPDKGEANIFSRFGGDNLDLGENVEIYTTQLIRLISLFLQISVDSLITLSSCKQSDCIDVVADVGCTIVPFVELRITSIS
jgi:hypothetical protein